MPTPLKPKSIYKKEINNLIKLISKKYPEVLQWKIDINKYCNDSTYRKKTKYRLLNVEKCREQTRKWTENNIERHREAQRNWEVNNRERRREINHRCYMAHPERVRSRFDTWTINNPRKAMLCAASGRMAQTIINRLWIRPTVCPHCGRSNCLIDFHHPNHLFWRKWTFCCKSCHYFFNRDKVPASDTIIDLKKLLRESISH